jgi:hypothetical protein
MSYSDTDESSNYTCVEENSESGSDSEQEQPLEYPVEDADQEPYYGVLAAAIKKEVRK